MSKLNDLIKELCPDGVEYKKLGSFTKILRGKRLTKNLLSDEYEFCVYHGGLEPLGKFKNYNRNENTVMIINVGASAGTIGFCKEKFWSSDGCFCVENNDSFSSRYLYYYLSNNENYFQSKVRKAGIPTLDASVVENYIIPLPPLPVQCEIVRILDNFTALTSALTAELTAQRKRYSGFLNSLLSFEGRDAQDWVLWKKLGDIAVNLDSRRIAVTKHNRKAGIYPYYGASGIVDYVDDYIFDGDFLLVSEDGANLVARSTPIAFSITGKNWVNNHAHVLKFDNIYLQKYVEIYLNLLDLSPYISKGAQPKLSQTSLKKIILPIPDDSRIRYVVDILDRFDKLCNDLSEGLPAEIAARQKQYEYYRDKLLTFKEKES